MKHKKLIAILFAVMALVFIGNNFFSQEDVNTSKNSTEHTSISIWLDAKEKTSFAEEMDKVYEKALADEDTEKKVTTYNRSDGDGSKSSDVTIRRLCFPKKLPYTSSIAGKDNFWQFHPHNCQADHRVGHNQS